MTKKKSLEMFNYNHTGLLRSCGSSSWARGRERKSFFPTAKPHLNNAATPCLYLPPMASRLRFTFACTQFAEIFRSLRRRTKLN